MINTIEISRHQPGKAYVVLTRYKFDDFKPYLYATDDYGKSWELRTDGIDQQAHLRVVREDRMRKGMLFAGSVKGLYISYDDGDNWYSFQLNLPITPITDLKVHHDDLIAATQGRAFWILDDLTPVRNWDRVENDTIASLVSVKDTYLWGGPRVDTLSNMGTNPDFGLSIYFFLPGNGDSTTTEIDIVGNDGRLIRKFSSDEKEKSKKLTVIPGLNKFVWDLRRPSLESIPGLMTFGGTLGSKLGPGKYSINLIHENDTSSQSFHVLADPLFLTEQKAHDEKQALLTRLSATTQLVFDAVKDSRYIRKQIEDFKERELQDTILQHMCDTISHRLEEIEKKMVQSKQKTFQDVINYPNQLDGKLIHIQRIIEGSPPPLTEGQKKRANDLLNEWSTINNELNDYISKEVEALNEIILEKKVPFISPNSPGKINKKGT
jgi:hypothetical protein